MSKWRKRIILLACGILALVLLWQVLRDREPSYQDRTLSQWFDKLPDSALYSDSDAAVIAITRIGTNALPTVLKWIGYEPTPIQGRIVTLAEEYFPPRISRPFTANERRARNADTFFLLLGEKARPAIPELTRLALTSSDYGRADRCIIALSHLGPEALPSVIEMLTNGPPHTRWAAISLVSAFENAEAAVPILIELLADGSSLIADQAGQTLGRLDRSAVIPSLSNAMQSASAQTRLRAVRCVLFVEPSVSEAVPALRPMLTDPDFGVRQMTTNALLQIAPGVLTNAPTQ